MVSHLVKYFGFNNSERTIKFDLHLFILNCRNCYPGSFDPKKVAGKIVVCVADDLTVSRKIKKLVVDDAKAKGLILIDEQEKSVPFDSGIFPFAEVGDIAGFQILNYINSTK